MLWFIVDLVVGCLIILTGVWMAAGLVKQIRKTWKNQ